MGVDVVRLVFSEILKETRGTGTDKQARGTTRSNRFHHARSLESVALRPNLARLLTINLKT